MGKTLLGLLLFISMMFAQVDLNMATKSELMEIKGIGSKKADAIIDYRKTNKINSADDLKNIKGFGQGIVSNVKNDVKISSHKAKMQEKKETRKAKMQEKKETRKAKMQEKKAMKKQKNK